LPPERRSFAAGTTELCRRNDEAFAPANDGAFAPANDEAFAPANDAAFAPANDAAFALANDAAFALANDEAFAPANDGVFPRNDRALQRERRSFANCHVVPAQAGTQWRSRAAPGHPQSIHPFARSTAFCHPRRIFATRSRDIAGSKRRSTRQLLVTSASLFQ
jgi:hypothetical protein